VINSQATSVTSLRADLSAIVACFVLRREICHAAFSDFCNAIDTTQIRHWAEDRRLFYHPCLVTRLGGVSGGKETQGWRDSSHTAMVGAGKFGSAKLPIATATYPGKPSPSQ
jgi:hypothetical protein